MFAHRIISRSFTVRKWIIIISRLTDQTTLWGYRNVLHACIRIISSARQQVSTAIRIIFSFLITSLNFMTYINYNWQYIYMFKLEFRRNFERIHVQNTRNRSTLNPSFARLSLTQHSLSFSAVSLWNDLPEKANKSVHIYIYYNILFRHILPK